MKENEKKNYLSPSGQVESLQVYPFVPSGTITFLPSPEHKPFKTLEVEIVDKERNYADLYIKVAGCLFVCVSV